MSERHFKIIHKRDVIRSVRDRWNKQYESYGDPYEIGHKANRMPVGEIRRRLAALDLETCTEADVNEAIGTTGWAEIDCDGCGKNVEKAIRIGDAPDYEARWQDLCIHCAARAAKMIANG